MDSFNFIRELKSTDKGLHAKVLGWLLNPKGTHGLGFEFLENFLLLINHRIDKNNNFEIFSNYEILWKEKFLNERVFGSYNNHHVLFTS